MKNTEIKALSADELKERIASEKENLQKLKFANAISVIENPMKLKQTRRLIARMSTELKVKEQITQ